MERVSAWGKPILSSVLPVIKKSEHVRTSESSIERVASWMAYEEFQLPSGSGWGVFDVGSDPDTIMDVLLLTGILNFAYTDFDTGEQYRAEYMGSEWCDAEGMFARVHEAIHNDVPILDGDFLSNITRDDLANIFRGNIEMPMLEERAEILNVAGRVLSEKYEGRFHNFVRDCAPAVYAQGDGLLERLSVEFPRFKDVSVYKGETVNIYKLAQLSLWSMHASLNGSGWEISDLENMTAFADYIVPEGLRIMDILEYTEELSKKIEHGEMIHRDSDEEIEIRAHTIYATALLTDAINRHRQSEMRLVIPQVDFRFWKTYHASFPTLKPHHLTRTIMY